MIQEIKNFILHLRLHYQFFILSGGYLLGGLLADQMNAVQFWMQFLNVHVLLYGGATAFNSYWDKDEGPIGGLKNPPKMSKWMHPASLLMMFAGWIWAFSAGLSFFLIYGLSLLLFWLYSTPHARWKGRPVLSLVAIGVSTGTNSVLLGFWAAGGTLSAIIIIGAVGASLVLLSLYPVSQAYQAGEDQKRGDNTFFLKYGLKGVKRFFLVSFLIGLLILSICVAAFYELPAAALFITGLCSFFIIHRYVSGLHGVKKEYQKVMNIKFFASLSFVIFLLLANSIRYEWIGRTFLNNYF
ncbi:MAG: hypothetical protein EA359_13575 [Balneolaceae bacterium]|nr:MAG: hypothetical protein EA359_13575 [Balneolaceae bacterium]